MSDEDFWMPLGIALVLAWFLVSITGCAGNPKPTRPEGVPYPTKLRPQARVYPMAQVRCLGSGLGGCPGWMLGR